MAITKIKPIKSTLKKALDYIQNPEKTDGKVLISSYGCSYETADIEFGFTISQAMEKGNNLAHHLMQSFSPAECAAGLVTPEKAHEMGKQLADRITKGQHEYVIATHVDKGHIHNHIIFCSVNFVDHHKYVSNKKAYYNIRNVSDEICRENGLSVIESGKERGKSYLEYHADKNGISYKRKLRAAIDMVLPHVSSMDELLTHLQKEGYEIKRGKYISCRAAEQSRFIRLKTLGTYYSEEALSERIQGIRVRGIPSVSRSINLIIDLENCIKAQENRGYEHWAKVFNLKQAAKTMNYLTENQLLSYGDLKKKLEDILCKKEAVVASIKEAERKLSELAVILKNCNVYQQTKPVYERYAKNRNSDQYRKHESGIRLHETAIKTLRAKGIHALPDMDKLQEQYDRLSGEKELLYQEYEKIKKTLKEIKMVKQNVDSMLRVQRNIEKDRQVEL